MLPDPGFLYLSKKHQAALTLLEYGLLNHVGFCVISGEPGAGKTTILRSLLERVGADVTIGLITNTHQSFGGLLDWVLSAFDLHKPGLTQVEMHQIFMDFLIDEYANNRTVLLIVDEAQNMKPDALEELRMLSNVNSAKDQLMQVVLAGQPALKETLRMPELMQFAQRIAVDYHLEALSLEETCGYIQHRLVKAGATRDVFTPASCERIYNYSGGTPRLINLLCETVLVYGFADQRDVIDIDLVDEMVQERMKDSVVPIFNRDIVGKAAEENEELLKNFPWIRPEGDTGGAGDTVPGADPGSTEKSETGPGAGTVSGTGAGSTAAEKDQPEAMISEAVVGDLPAATGRESSTISASMKKSQQAPAPVSAAGSTPGQKPEQQPEQQPKPVVSPAPKPVPGSSHAGVPGEDTSEMRKQIIKYGVIAALIGVVLIVLAMVLDNGWSGEVSTEPADEAGQDAESRRLEQERLARERLEKDRLEQQRLEKMQLETEALRRERDAAIERAEKEKQAKLEAERLAAEKAAAAVKAAEEQRKREQQRKITEAREAERKAQLEAEKARLEAERVRQEAAALEQQRLEIERRLEEERRLKEAAEAKRLELERQREAEQLAAQQAAQEATQEATQEVAQQAAEAEKKIKSADCTGPAARFKSGCR